MQSQHEDAQVFGFASLFSRGQRMVLLWLGWTFVLPAFGGNSAPAEEPRTGIVVEQVQNNFEGAKAGIQKGDVLLRWSRGDAQGEIESPFDLNMLEIEQEPQGTVTMEGLRGTEKLSWTLGPGNWRIKARPNLTADILAGYLHGEELARADKLTDAVTTWREIAHQIDGRAPAWLASWFMFHAGEALAGPQRSKDADEAYDQAIQFSTNAEAMLRALVFRAWALQCEQRGDLENAARHFQQSLEESQKKNPENLLAADNLNSLGRIAGKRGDLARAEPLFRQSLDIRNKLAPQSLMTAGTLSNLGLLARSHGDPAKADDYLRRALAIREKLAPDSLDVALVLNNLGLLAEDRGDLEAAKNDYVRTLEIRQKLAPGSMELAGVLNNLGNVAEKLGEFEAAQHYQMDALEIRKRLAPDSGELAESYNNLGILAMDRGDLATAEEDHLLAFDIRRRKLSAASLEVAASLFNLGDVALLRHDLTRAEDYHNRSLAIKEQQAPGSVNMARSLARMALLQEERGNLASAETYLQRALKINGEKAAGSLAVAQNFNRLADLAIRQKHPSQAQEDLNQALKIAQEIAPAGLNMAESFRLSGELARSRGEVETAERFYRQAIEILEKLTPGSIRLAETLAALAGTVWQEHRAEEADQIYERALMALESQTATLGGAEEVRSGFRATYSEYYSRYIDLLVAEKKPDLALQIFERSRGRTLMEMLKAASVDVRKGVDAQLLGQERALREKLTESGNRQIMILNGPHTEQQAASVKQEMERLLAEYGQVQSQIRAGSPDFAALTQPQPLTVRAIQQLLDRDTLLLEYALGESHSYVWVVAQDSLEYFELPTRAQIDLAAIHLYKTMASLHTATASVQGAATALSRMVLAPVVAKIGKKRLVVVGDGALQYIPFAALPVPGSRATPLMAEHEIVNAPSASVLGLVRQAGARRQPAPKTVAVLADPVFDLRDPRVDAAAASRQGSSQPKSRQPAVSLTLATSHVTRSAGDLGWSDLARLPFSQREAAAILAVTPPGKGMEALGFDASRAKVTSGELTQYRVVHFATHGLLNNEHPEFSGLVLSLVDKEGQPQNGFVMLQDIYNLNLPAELVVLSACETALGKEIRGEGLIGLTRGFMYAGATRVLATLWNVDDVATAELMTAFYQAMERDSMTSAAALRQAQMHMWRQKRWHLPYYWAGFQLQGEWK